MTSADPAQLLLVALHAARAAGEGLLAAQRTRLGDGPVGATTGAADDPVAAADRAAGRTVADTILAERPDDGVLGEQQEGGRRGSTGLRWVVDPLSGTANFRHHVPLWSVSVAVEDDDGPVVGVVHHPPGGETFHALRGGGAWLAQRRLAVHDVGGLDRAMVVTGVGEHRTPRVGRLGRPRDGGRRARHLRRFGSAALDTAWVAAGRVQAVAATSLDRRDWLAAGLLVTEAGGRLSHVEVSSGTTAATTMVAGAPTSHDELVALLHDA